MGNVFAVIKPILRCLMKVIGMRSKLVEIEAGTTLHFGFQLIKPSIQLSLQLTSFAIYVPDLLFFGDSFTNCPQRSISFHAHFMVGFKLAQLYPHVVESMVMSSTVIEMTESISNASLNNIGFTNWPDFLLPKTIADLKVLLSIGSHKSFLGSLNFCSGIFLRYVMFGNRMEKVELFEALVVGDKDATPPKYSQLSGHLVQLERPYTYNRCLKKYLSCSSGYGNE
ncbi:hypothetical protein R3W88_003860 [Solanum pinnatisectum]|uniref:Uncharacterized protein n=1 Tax=Solanum pinnatisectum TaxID=50273 RepID=A0AAV9MQR8_9SOLN|nr:hypothetical protein R3W88_003860 [Solanum pinnatisectum]